MNNKIEIAPFQPENFKSNLDNILSRQLTPETIDTYASDALDDLIELTIKVTSSYDQQPTVAGSTNAQSEDFSFSYFELGELEKSLDHIADLSESIQSIDTIMKSATTLVGPIVPTRDTFVDIRVGETSFIEKNIINRLKTTLFLLEQDFGIDIHNKESLILKTASTDGMMRKSSYNFIEVTELERSILVCDEEGNVTYVFDTSVVVEYNSELDLTQLTKAELNELITNVPGIGKRIVYSSNFMNDMKSSIDEIGLSETEHKSEEIKNNYLQSAEFAPEGFLTAGETAKKFSVDRKTIIKAVDALIGQLGVVITAKKGRATQNVFSHEQQQTIEVYLEQRGLFNEKPPKGYLTVSAMARKWKIDYTTVVNALGKIEEVLGEIAQAKLSGHVTAVYSTYQQAMLEDYLVSMEIILPDMPDNFKGINELSKKFCLNRMTVEKAIKILRPQLGDVVRSKFGARVADAFSPSQQEIIRIYLEERGNFAEFAQEGYLSLQGLVEKYKLSRRPIERIIDQLGDNIGVTLKLRFGSIFADAYSVEQQLLIKQKIDEYKAGRTV
ncbi:MAG: hypothetical protein ABIQ04_03880 [Candidatus Saccharimonadales bacterium]